jgi:hypothetical protein
MWPIIPFIIPVVHFGWDMLLTILQWPSIEAML